jgi:adenosylcobinamide kinase/adenosylcobinamide-phosphate guanylyltransferase
VSGLTLLLGGVRSGKSARAVELARAGERVLFVATAGLHDDDMRARAEAHRVGRPASWNTLEETMALAESISAQDDAHDLIVIDCLTLWISNLLCASEPPPAEREIADHVRALLQVQRVSRAHWIVVSNEVGLGVVPPTPLGRAYRDALGRANQLVAAAATRVDLMVAGLELRLKG